MDRTPDAFQGHPLLNWVGGDAPCVRGGGRPWRAYALAAFSILACTVLGKILAGAVDEAHMILVYLVVTLPVALRGDRGAAITAALLVVAAFDFFFVPPHYTFVVADPQYLLTFAVMGLVGVIISSLTAMLSAALLEARQREDRARALSDMSQALLAARAEAEAARTQAETERLRSALLSSVSHDLRTPLAGIMGAASSLVDGAEALHPEVRRDLALGIVEESDRLTKLVTNLLQATRLDAGAIALSRAWIPLDEAVAPALARLGGLLGDRPLSLALPPDLPHVFADPVLLEQVFANLVENCAKHTPPGTAIAIGAQASGDMVNIEVADEGPGLPDGEEERVFEKFRRYPNGSGAQGAGLGLAIVRAVIEAHGGRIDAANQPKGGVVFRFGLPAAKA